MDPQQAADVNWLLSAITQSAAALIAIVGGLLVSRYVSLHAEQQGARRRVDDLLRREAEAQDQLAQHERAFDLYYVDEFLDDGDVFETILREKGHATVAQVLAEMDTDGDGLNPELLEERLTALQVELGAAVGALVPVIPVEKDHESWLDFRRGRDFDVGHRGLWEWVYDRICDDKRGEAKRAEAEARAKSPYAKLIGPAFAHDDLLASISMVNPQIRALRGVTAAQHENAQVNVLQGRVETARAEVRALQQEHRLAQELFEATRQPEGFGLALQVLATLAVLGIGAPVVIMGFVPYSLPAWLRIVVIALFFLGVVVLLRFLFVYAKFLRGARRGLPSWLGGLVRSDKA